MNAPTIAKDKLKSLTPMESLSYENFEELYKKTTLETLKAGRYLMKHGEQDNFRYYLISGKVTLSMPSGESKQLDASDPVCRFPLAAQVPRRMSVRAVTDIEYIRIDNDLLDILLTWDQSTSYVVSDIEESGQNNETDWMSNILSSSIFHKVPPANIQAVFMRFEEVPVKQGQIIIKQGDVPDYFYMIQQGEAEVTRSTPELGKTIRLATLSPGDSFGEEALLTRSHRNATVMMTTNGILMRLAAGDFSELLSEPVLNKVNLKQAQSMQNDGAILLDVRLLSEANGDSLEGSLHIPFSMLRVRLKNLDHAKPYIVYCDTGRRSSAAAYLLSTRGIEAYVLTGGLNKYVQSA